MKIYLAVICLVIGSTSAVAQENSDTAENRHELTIQAALNSQFEDAAKTFSSSELVATFSFVSRRKIDFVLKKLKRHDLRLIGFHHGDDSGVGGYVLGEHEELDEAINSYESTLVQNEAYLLAHFRQELGAVASEQIDAANNEERRQLRDLQKSLEHEIKLVERRIRKYSSSGVELTGVDLIGTAAAMDRFASKNPMLARVVEIGTLSRRASAFVPEQ